MLQDFRMYFKPQSLDKRRVFFVKLRTRSILQSITSAPSCDRFRLVKIQGEGQMIINEMHAYNILKQSGRYLYNYYLNKAPLLYIVVVVFLMQFTCVIERESTILMVK